jgi:glycosyltransferase involved in cell wall biosynthesis
MQRGIPVVASNAGPLPEVLGDAAGYHDPRDPAALVDAMDAVLDNEALRLERIRKGREQAAKYTWDRAAREMVELLNGLGDCA